MESTIKKNKIIIILAILFGLACLSSLSAFVLTSSYSHAESTDSTLASVTVPDVCTLEDSVVGTAHTATVSVGSYTPNIGETTIKVTCNDNNGYSLYAVGYSNNTVGNTNLIGTNGNIVTGTANDGSVSNWAMKLTAVSGSFTPTILNGYDNYHIVPDTATKVATRTESIDVSSTSEIKTTYAVSISPSQAKGDYNGKVKYTVVHPNYTNADGTRETVNVPVTFAGQGVSSVTFAADGYPTRTVSASGGTASLAIAVQYTMTASFTSGYELESWALNSPSYGTIGSTTINPTTFIPDTNSASAVITITGVKPCIATISGTMQDFSPADLCSDVASGTLTDSRDNQTYTVKKINGAWWMTRNLAIGCNGSGSTYGDAISSKTLTNSDSNISATTWSTPTLSLDKTDNTTNCTTSSTDGCNSNTDARMKCSSTYGAWYNYAAATAGTIATDSTTTEDTYNICPKGWTLPANGTSAGQIGSVTSYKDDFSPVAGGYYSSGDIYYAIGGYWWSTTAYYDGTSRNGLTFYGSSLDTGNLARRFGFYIRCIKL